MQLTLQIQQVVISTHTPLARRDDILEQEFNETGISTHTPLARRDYFPICMIF